MNRLKAHFLKSFVAGIVALLPIASVVATVVYFENQVATGWLKNQGFYFFGLGLLLATLLIYLIGLTVTTILGRWFWRRLDLTIDGLPLLGSLYLTIKQLLGYGTGPKGIFQRVVLVPTQQNDRFVLGLVTREPSSDTQGQLVVFLPAAPRGQRPTGLH